MGTLALGLLAKAYSRETASVVVSPDEPVSCRRSDGWEATSTIKADVETNSIPIIVLTAHAMAGDREKALDAGADEYDTKPIEFKRLLGKIKEFLND